MTNFTTIDSNILEGVYIEILYFLIGLIASLFGAITGIGGGVIIKPILDSFGHYDVATIGILSAATVFSMSCVSLIKATFTKINIKIKTSTILAISSILGGMIGKIIFNNFIHSIENLDIVSLVQSTILTILMVIIFIYYKNSIKTYQLRNTLFIFLIGIMLGIIAAFLGIGGGPFNVAVLTLGFSMNAKDASINSLFIIFFSQISSLITTQITTGYDQFNLELLPYIIVGGIVGGFVGSYLLNKINTKKVERIFSTGVMIIMLLNIFNVGKILYFI